MAKKVKRMGITDAELPISAMIDVVFLLLIYFVVTQKPVIEETYLGADLPAPGPPGPPPPKMFTIDVHKMSNDPIKDLDIYYVCGRKWNFKDLQELLITTGKNTPDQTIIINCGPNAQHRKLVQLLDACAAAKLTKLNMVDDETVQFVPEVPRERSKKSQ